MRVARLLCKVTALSKHGSMLPTDSRVKIVLADAVNHVLRRPMKQMPLVDYSVTATHFPVHVFLFPITKSGQDYIQFNGHVTVLNSFS